MREHLDPEGYIMFNQEIIGMVLVRRLDEHPASKVTQICKQEFVKQEETLFVIEDAEETDTESENAKDDEETLNVRARVR